MNAVCREKGVEGVAATYIKALLPITDGNGISGSKRSSTPIGTHAVGGASGYRLVTRGEIPGVG